MKQCPICKEKFPDSEEFCPVHGVKLDEYKSSAAKAWIAAGAGILSIFLYWHADMGADVEFGGWLLLAALSVTAVILPRGSEAAFPKWCAYISGYLMLPLLVGVWANNWYWWF